MRLNTAIGNNQHQKTVRNWLERLPMTNHYGSGEQLLEIQTFIQKNETSPTLRLALQAQLFARSCQWLLQLEQQFAENACNHAALRLARMGSRVLAQQLEAIQHMLKTSLNTRPLLAWRRRAQQELTLALDIAQRYACFALRCHVELNASYWLCTHYLYYHAMQHGWLKLQTASGSSVLSCYQQLQLLGITDGKHMSGEEIETAIRLSEQLADKVELSSLQTQQHTHAGHIYLLDLTRGSPPQFLLYSDSLRRDEHCLAFELHQVIARLQHYGSTERADGRPNRALTVIVAHKLAESWTTPRRRRHNRQSILQSMSLIAQMRVIRQVLGSNSDQPAQREQPEHQARRSHIAIFQALNKSDSGLLLRGNPGRQSLHIGELLLLADKQAHRMPSLYAVRWTAVSEHANEVSCGAELIGNDPEAVDVIPLGSNPRTGFQPALRLHANQGEQISNLLIVPGQPFALCREFRLRDRRGEHNIRVTRVHMQTALYQAMEFQRT